MTGSLAAASLAALLLGSGAEAPREHGGYSVPEQLVLRALTLPKGTFELAIGTRSEEEHWAGARFVTAAAGVTDTFTVALASQLDHGASAGATWAIARSEHQDLAIRAVASYMRVVPRGGRLFFDTGAWRWSGTGSLLYKVHGGRFALDAAVEFHTELERGNLGPRDRGSVLLQPELQITSRLAALGGAIVTAETPAGRPFLGGSASVPVFAGLVYQVYRAPGGGGLDIASSFWFDDLRHDTGSRTLYLGAAVRF